MPKSRKRPKAAAKAKQRRRAAQSTGSMEDSGFVKSPWETWSAVRAHVDAGGISAEALQVVEHLPFRSPQGAWTTLHQIASDPAHETVEDVVNAFQELENAGYLLWDPADQAALTMVPEHAPTQISAEVKSEPKAQEHVCTILATYEARIEAELAEVQEIEAKGGRIVNGGQTGRETWEILDWRTETVLAQGDNGMDGFDRTWTRMDPDNRWYHFDRISEAVYDRLKVPATAGLPSDLAEMLEDWVGDRSTTDQEIAEMTGLDVERVEYCRCEGVGILRAQTLV